MRTVLDVKLIMLSGNGDLALSHAARDSWLARRPRSSRATQAKRDRERPRGPPRHVKPNAPFSSCWTERHARCRYCEGPPWNRECPKRNSRAERADDKPRGTAALAIEGNAAPERDVVAATQVNSDDKTAQGAFDEAVLTMLDGSGDSTASLTFSANEQGAALCVRGAPQNLVTAEIAHAPKPVHIPPLSAAAELEEQDAHMLHLAKRSDRERRDRAHKTQLNLLETEYDPRTSESDDGSMRPLKPYENV
eukprot:5194792-Pleurochrysis_carterae.AAC.4